VAARTTINVNPVNDAPTLDLDANDSSGQTGADFSTNFVDGGGPVAIVDTDASLFDADDTILQSLTVVITDLQDGAGNEVLTANTAGTNIIASYAGGTLTLTGTGTDTVALYEQVLRTIQYDNGQDPATGTSRTITFVANDGVNNSNIGTTFMSINAGNIAPTVDLDANDSSGATGNDYLFTFTEGDGPTAIADSDTDLVDVDSLTFTHVALSVSGLLDGNAETFVLDGDTFALATAVAGQNTTGGNYHVVITTGAGTATVTITKQGGGLFNETETETLITAIQYQHTDTSTPTDGDRLIDVIVNDGTADSAAALTTINVNPVNDQPSFSGLDNTPTFTEGGAAVVLDNNATIADPELDAANNYNGATLTLVRNGGANGNDVFDGSGTLNPLVQSGSLVVGGTPIGTVTTNSGGTLVLTFNGSATTALVNSALQQITYANTNGTPPPSVQIDFTINDGNAGGQGSGPALNGTGSITVTITAANTAPTVDLDANDSSGATGNDYMFTFTEGDGPTAIADTDTDLVDVDSTSFASGKLAVSGLLDGNAEVLVLDGDTFALGTAVAGQDTTGGNYHVVIGTGAGTATVTIIKQGGGLFTEGETETLITAIQYQHTDTSAPTDGDRLIDVIVNDGTDDSTAARTTINVNPVNAPPVAVADGFTVLEGSTNTLNLAGNDTDADDGLDLTSITIISGPTNGTIDSINVNGTVDYTHDGSETLADSFTYTIDDLAGATSNTVTVSLTVTPQNDAPIITSNGGGTSATVTVIEGNTAVTDVNASDAEGSPLTFSLIGGADAAKFSIDPTTGVLTFNTAPDSEAPGDVGGDNVYNVVVQVSDGTAADTQTIAVTVTKATPVFIPPPPPDPIPDPTPPPTDGDGDDGESEDETSEGGVPVVASSPGSLPGGGQGSTEEDSRDSDTGNNLAAMELRTENTSSLGNALDEILDILRKPFDRSAIKGEIQAILTRWGFLEDLDRVRDAFQDVTATEQTYLASSVAASTGLSIGYVFWLLRSGVLLTALLSSLPAWQFVNPLLVLDKPEKKKRKKDQEDPEDDSVESMFEKHTVPAETSETQTDSKAKEHESRWSRRTPL